ncbi:hypothetical protein [Salininema proteolyticum]|uniref:HNH endonuclease n=1 Tax=Salininema proteolyticum TaxID=1607685 RepID=A0ABV8TWP8_9ACTN
MAAPWRTSPLPSGWRSQIRPDILARDAHRCTWNRGHEDGLWPRTTVKNAPAGLYSPEEYPTDADHPERCSAVASDVDHIGPADDHRPENLRALCTHHHRRRTGRQGAAARAKLPPRNRPRERHPGLVGDNETSSTATKRSGHRRSQAGSAQGWGMTPISGQEPHGRA